MSDLQELSDAVARFVEDRDWAQFHSPKNLAAAIAIEAAELQQIYLWRELDDLAPDKEGDIEREAADIAICLINFCNRTGINLKDAVLKKLAEAEGKYPAGRVRGRADKYDEYPEWTGE